MAIIQAGQMINRKCRPYNLALPSLIISEETICVAVKCQLIISTYFIATAAVLRGRPAARFLGPALAHDLFDHRPQLVLLLLHLGGHPLRSPHWKRKGGKQTRVFTGVCRKMSSL